MKKLFLIPLIIILVAGLIFSGCAKPAPAPAPAPAPVPKEPIELSLATMWPVTDPQTEALVRWTEKVEADTNGRVHITIYAGGVLASPMATWKELQEGVCDIGSSVSYYEPVGFELTNLAFVCSYGMGNVDEFVPARRYVHGKLREEFPELREEYAKNKLLFETGPTSTWIHTAEKPIRIPEDLKGLTLRVASADFTPVFEAIGASVIKISMSEAYISLEKGIMDGIVSGPDVLKTMRLADVVHYHTEVTEYTAYGIYVAMNWDVWNSLPPDIQEIIDESCEWGEAELDNAWLTIGKEGAEYAKSVGNTFIQPEQEERWDEFFEAGAREAAAKVDAKGLRGTEFFERMRQLIAEYHATK